MRHNRIRLYMIYALMLALIVTHLAGCTNSSSSVKDTEPIVTEEITRPPSVSITEPAKETEAVMTQTASAPESSSQAEVPESTESISEAVTEEKETASEPVTEKQQTESQPESVIQQTESQGQTSPEEPVTEKPVEQETTPSKETVPETTAAPEKPTEAETTSKETTSIQQVEVPATQVKEYTGPISVKSNSAPGTETYSGNGATIDASNKASGYLMVKYEGGGDKRVKVRVSLNGVNYDYDLNTQGSYEAYPLQMGNGSYTVIVMQNVYDNQYAMLHSATINVELSSSGNPYLYPSQKVNFTSSSSAVKKSYDLCVGLTTDEEKVTAIYNYIIQNVTYDYDKAAQVTSGALTSYNSSADTTLSTNKGICLDYATLMAVMLRAQNIPTQMIFGSEASASYHAWNKVYYNGGWVLYDSTYGAGGATGSGYTEMKRY